MIGLDTNVLVRYIVQDDAAQAAKATQLIEQECTESEPAWVSDIVLVELVWVLTRFYGYERALVADTLTAMLMARELRFFDKASVFTAVDDYRQGPADFSDFLIARRNQSSGCLSTVTFDRKAARHANFRLL